MTGNPYSVSVRTPEILDKLEKHPIWQQRAQEKAARVAGHARRDRRRLRHQGLRHRRRLFAGARRTRRRTARSRSTAIMSRWATASAPRSPTGWRSILGGVADEVSVARVDSYDVLGARHLRRSLYDGPEDAGRSRRRIRAGCPRSVRRPVRRSARMSGRTRRPKPRASSSASACGRLRWNFGAYRRTTRAQKTGRRRSGRTGSLFMPGLTPLAIAGARRDRACDAIS